MGSLKKKLKDKNYTRVNLVLSETNHFEVTAKINGIRGRFILDTGINKATKGVASVQVARPGSSAPDQKVISQDADILFVFIMQGNMDLKADGHDSQSLYEGDAYVMPPDLIYQITNCSDELELLEVALPGDFNTMNHY